MTAYDLRGKRQLLRSGVDRHPIAAQFLKGSQPHKGGELLADPIPRHVAQFQFHQLQVGLDEPEVET
jgi:hypothetical protein